MQQQSKMKVNPINPVYSAAQFLNHAIEIFFRGDYDYVFNLSKLGAVTVSTFKCIWKHSHSL